MQYKEMLEKTTITIIGICKGVSEYVNKDKKSYFSVDVEVKDTKMPVNVRLPENFNRAALGQYELVKIPVCIKPSWDRMGIVLEALV